MLLKPGVRAAAGGGRLLGPTPVARPGGRGGGSGVPRWGLALRGGALRGLPRDDLGGRGSNGSLFSSLLDFFFEVEISLIFLFFLSTSLLNMFEIFCFV
jgi:hypothetical protein